MKNVALLGLGIMGRGLGGNILKAGHRLTVYNRSRDKAEPFAARGAQVANSPREAAAGAEVVIACVGDDAASRACGWATTARWPGPSRARSCRVQHALPGVDARAGRPGARARLRLPRRADGGQQSRSGQCRTDAVRRRRGGVVEKARPVLEAISRRIAHLGPNGAGATYKLINNMMAAAQVAGLAEGMRLAEAAGLDMSQD